MANAINLPDSGGPLSENVTANEEVMSEDTLILQEAAYKNATTLMTILSRAQTTGQDYVIQGLQLVWSTSLTTLLKTGVAVSTQGEYYNQTGTWSFIANSGSAGATFSVFNPSDASVTFATGSSIGARIDVVQIRPNQTLGTLLARNIYNPITNTISSQNVDTRINFNCDINVVTGTPGSASAPATTAGWIKIAEVTVPQNATSITQSNIVDWEHSYQWTTSPGVTIWGGFSTSQRIAVNTNYTIPTLSPFQVIDATGGTGGITVTLPPSGQIPAGMFFTINKVDSGVGTVTIAPSGSDTIGGASSIILSNQFQTLNLISIQGSFSIVSIPSYPQPIKTVFNESSNFTIPSSASVPYGPSSTSYYYYDVLVNATGGSGGITITLPAASALVGQKIQISKSDSGAGAITITPNGSDSIGNAGNVSCYLGSEAQQVTLVSIVSGYWAIVDGAFMPAQSVDTNGGQYYLGGLVHLPLGNTTSRSVFSISANPTVSTWTSAIQVTGSYGVPTGAKAIRAKLYVSAISNASGTCVFGFNCSDNTTNTPTSTSSHPYIEAGFVATGQGQFSEDWEEADIPLNSSGQFYIYWTTIANLDTVVASHASVSVVGYYMGA